MQHDEIPKLPEILPTDTKEHEMEAEEFMKAKNRLFFADKEDGEPYLRFDKLDDSLYATLVVLLSATFNKKLYEFLKLVLEGVRLVLEDKKKSYESAIRIEKYLKHNEKNEAY